MGVRKIMIQGTMSGAGKSLLCAGLCRLFSQDGFRVAPFKSQNMALNSFATKDGLEMGRAQVVQAQAARIEPDVRMNPILLKPTSDSKSQVIIRGRARENLDAASYHSMKAQLLPDVLDAFNSLASEVDIMVIEGAGSPAEINLRENDIVNMGLALALRAPVLLVGDIDRGGVFAQLYGTTMLLTPEEQQLLKGLIVNKFRGDIELFKPGVAMLEELCRRPVIGVVPYLQVDIDDEDSLAPRLTRSGVQAPLDVAVIRLPRISNFTDFAPLERNPYMGVRYVSDAASLGKPDMVILPGTKSTMDDLHWLKDSGLALEILLLADEGVMIFGICGGYQMLGRFLHDPLGVEGSEPEDQAGLVLLPVETTFEGEKRLRQVHARAQAEPFGAISLEGYEIHTGRTVVEGSPFCILEDGSPDGCVQGNVFGTYLHGVFDRSSMVEALVRHLLAISSARGDNFLEASPIDSDAIQPMPDKQRGSTSRLMAMSQREYLDAQYDVLATQLRQSLDMDAIYRILEESR